MEKYPEVFSPGIGRFPGPPYHFRIDENVCPKQTPCRPVPVNLKEEFKRQIDQMLDAGILKHVKEATPWISSFVIVEGKENAEGNKKMRICLDPSNLNKAVFREPYFSKTPVDIVHLLTNAKVITATTR